MNRVFSHFLLFISTSFMLSSCVAPLRDTPTPMPILDEMVTFVAEDVDVGRRVLFKDEPLAHYMIGGVEAYCTMALTMKTDNYKCFAKEGEVLTKGLLPSTGEWEVLLNPIKLTTRPLNP